MSLFNVDNTTPVASNGTALAGNVIHKVKFTGAEKETMKGKDGTEYPVVAVKFEAVDGSGSIVDNIFAPTSATREKSGPNNYLNPSSAEQFQTRLRQYIAALNPTLDKAITEGTKTLGAKDWDGMRDIIVAALISKGKNINKEVELKVLKNSKGYAQIPGFVAGLTKPNEKGESNVYHTTKFIGEGLSFTDKELKQIQKQNEAKAPSNMGTVAPEADPLAGGSMGGSEDLEFDINDL